jgi:ABC-type glycerol-3-phosphate transport system substrate-binding protein
MIQQNRSLLNHFSFCFFSVSLFLRKSPWTNGPNPDILYATKESERKKKVSSRKYLPIAVGALALVALLLLFLTRGLDFSWNAGQLLKHEEPVVPASGQRYPVRDVELNVNVSLPKESYIQLLEYNESFMAKYPYITVHIHNEGEAEGLYGKWLEQSRSGLASDVMLMDNGWVLPFAVKGYLKPAESLMSVDALSDQLAGLTEPLRWNGYLWGVPKEANPDLLLWNKRLLDKSGLKEPPRDEASLQEAASALTSPDGSYLSLAEANKGELRQLLLWCMAFYGKGEALLNLEGMTERQREGLEWLDASRLTLAEAGKGSQEMLQELIEKDLALAFMMTWEQYAKLPEASREKLLPDKRVLPYAWLGGSSFTVSSRSKAAVEAMLWIEEVTGTDAGRLAYEYSAKLPVRASLYAEIGGVLPRTLLPPVWWYEAASAKLPEQSMPRTDADWPLRWQRWQEELEMLPGGDWSRFPERLAATDSTVIMSGE